MDRLSYVWFTGRAECVRASRKKNLLWIHLCMYKRAREYISKKKKRAHKSGCGSESERRFSPHLPNTRPLLCPPPPAAAVDCITGRPLFRPVWKRRRPARRSSFLISRSGKPVRCPCRVPKPAGVRDHVAQRFSVVLFVMLVNNDVRG